MTRTLVCSDWHLGSYTPEAEAALALRFLEWVQAGTDRLVLNGDIFEGLFEAPEHAESAQPRAAEVIARLQRDGRAQRLCGNHDPRGGAAQLVLDHPRFGRVLVTHGHVVDPVHASSMGHFGDGISRRFGYLGLVRGAAWLAEASVALVASRAVDRVYREKCLGLIDRAQCALGIFGHNHRRHLVAGDHYANAGRLTRSRLEYLLLDERGAALRDFTARGDMGDSTGDVARVNP